MIECKFSLELTKNGVQKTIYAKSGEFNSRKVVITLTESGKVFDSHLYVYRVYCQEENSTAVPKYWDEIKVVNGCIEFTLPDEWLTAGDKVCELKVYSGTESLFSPLFRIIVAQSLGGGAEAVPTGKDVRYQEALPDLPEGSAEEGGEVAVFNPEENQVRRVKLSEIVVDETDPTVPAWAKQANPPSYTAEDVGALPADTTIPSKTSQLDNDSKFITEDEVDEKGNGLLSEIPNKAEMDGSALKFKRDDTELFEVELPAGGGEGGLASIPVADSDTLGGIKIPNNSEIKVDSSGNIGMNYSSLNGYSISAVLATSLLYEGGARIRTNISATLEDANSFVQNFIYDLLLENTSALALTVFESGDLIYLDENYEEKIIKVSPNSVYVFKLVDYVMTVKRYEGNELRKLIVEGI